MKYMKRTQIYKASNVTFNPATLSAYSYNWWKFVAKIDGKIVFNNYRYSPSTGKHQAKVRKLLETLGIKVDVTLPVPNGLHVYTTLKQVVLASEEHLCDAFVADKLRAQDRYHANKAKKSIVIPSVTELLTVQV